MKVEVTVTARLGPKIIAKVVGEKHISHDVVPLAEWEKVIEVEQWLEKMTGYRWHIFGI